MAPTVPAAPFRELLQERLVKLETADRNNPIISLSQETGISYRRLFSILKDQDRMAFDTADKIVTRLRGPMLWHQREDLSEIYYSADLSGERNPYFCRNGHEKAKYGTYSNGECRRCKIESRRRNQKNKSGKTRKLRVEL